ncbi:hypothetical protein [Microcella sp.]|uniref:hypothetical protein n=1 Tax=Microcella sp. TaxID=1913979 RepID=UPI003919D8BE
MNDDEQRRPATVVRATVRPWADRLAWTLTAVLAGSALVITEVVDGALAVVVRIGVVGAFLLMVAALAIVTVRLRTSLRSDGTAVVVRGPFGASVVPFHDSLAVGRWLDTETRRPVIWLTDHGAPIVRVPPRIDPVRIELFASRVGLEVAERDGAPPAPPEPPPVARDQPDEPEY